MFTYSNILKLNQAISNGFVDRSLLCSAVLTVTNYLEKINYYSENSPTYSEEDMLLVKESIKLLNLSKERLHIFPHQPAESLKNIGARILSTILNQIKQKVNIMPIGPDKELNEYFEFYEVQNSLAYVYNKRHFCKYIAFNSNQGMHVKFGMYQMTAKDPLNAIFTIVKKSNSPDEDRVILFECHLWKIDVTDVVKAFLKACRLIVWYESNDALDEFSINDDDEDGGEVKIKKLFPNSYIYSKDSPGCRTIESSEDDQVWEISSIIKNPSHEVVVKNYT